MSSSPSTPRSTRSASSPGGSPAILTPGRKIKAMLATFDSDSDSERENSGSKTTTTTVTRQQLPSASNSKPELNSGWNSEEKSVARDDDEEEEEEEEDDDIIMPRGRMAARMQAQTLTQTQIQIQNKQDDSNSDSASEDNGETAYERVARRLRAEKEKQQQPSETQSPKNNISNASSEDEDEDDIPTAGFRRKLTNARNSPDASPSRDRSSSPLFVSSPASRREASEAPDAAAADSDNDDDDDVLRRQPNDRLRALVAQKRKEREERERIEAEKKAARAEQMKQFSDEFLSGEDSGEDRGSGRKLTQQSRAPRKASKKALEEMSRETQRMSRNMQLAHQAKTKKKISKESFFARFNFMQPKEQHQQQQQKESLPAAGPESSSMAGSQNSSDAEGQKEKATPPTSPVREASPQKEKNEEVTQQQTTEPTGEVEAPHQETEIPSVEEPWSRPPEPQQEVTVGRAEIAPAPAQPEAAANPKPERKPLTKPPVRVRISRDSIARHQKEDSDSDLEVVTSPAKCRRIAAFENLPIRKAQESASMLKLRALAHLTSPTRRSTSMSPAELSASLRLRARQQAAKERQERIEELRAKGIIIETAEDRAAMEDDVEDLMEKARKEAEEIAKREKAAQKKQKGEDVDMDDSEVDDDYEYSGSDGEGEGGDEENEEEEEDGEEEEEGEGEDEDLVDNEAGEGDESEDQQSEAMSEDEKESVVPTARRKRPTRVISDDEDDEEQLKTPAKSVTQPPESAKRPQFPDMPTSGNLSMSLSQAFAGTLGDNSQQDTQQDSLEALRDLPDPGLPSAEFQKLDSQVMVKDSQADPIDLFAGYNSRANSRVPESPATGTFSQYSQIPDPTQDAGFVMSPFDNTKRFMQAPPSTVDTVPLSENGSPIANRKGRLLRRGRVPDLSDVEEDAAEKKASAFEVMRKASKKKSAVPFDRNKSKAKEMMDEAAEESEDEYAGLGGASDDSEGEEDEYDRQMINDNSGEVVNEKELAALNAKHLRDKDEKEVSKLLKDITTGALRRRRGGDDDLDLDDSDDERMARRREKRREFAKMRKALLADEKIGEIAENPKKAAFFRAIEDRDMDDEMDLDFLEEEDSGSQDNVSSQEVQQDASNNDTTTGGSNKRKRPLEPSTADIANRPPPHLRRTAASAVSKKPSTLAEIRETVSFLTETPEYDSFHEDASLDDEEPDEHDNDDDDDDKPSNEEGNNNNAAEEPSKAKTFAIPSHPRRTRGPVVDRLALLRQASSNSASSNGKAAFQSLSSSSSKDPTANIGFRPPPLLRRVTTGSSSASSVSSSSASSSTSSAVRTTKAPPQVTAKKGAVNYYTAARERERERELRVKQRSGGGSNIAALLNKHAGSGLGSLAGKAQWE